MRLMPDDEPAPRPRKKAKVAKEGDPAVQRMFQRYHDGYVGRWNVKPVINGGLAGKRFKEFLAVWGEELLGEVLDFFFVTKDPQVQRGDYALTGTSGAFFHHAQRLMQLLRGNRRGGNDDRTMENIDAAHRATRSNR